MAIYTRTGDKGLTSLFDGTRVSKADIRVDTYGTIDELNSSLGLAISFMSTKHNLLKKELVEIQHDLLEIGSNLAMPAGMPLYQMYERPVAFEKLIDSLTAKMPSLTQFILPSGSRVGSALHVSRTIARRVERRVIGLMKKEQLDEVIIRYFNRLSDLLFTMARYANYVDKKKEVVWKKR